MHAWIASHSRDVSCTRMDAVSWHSRFLSISVYCLPSPEALPNCPICRTGCTFIPKRANSPWTLLTFYKMPEIPAPCHLLTCTHRYLPVLAHLPCTWRRPQCRFCLSLLLCCLNGCCCAVQCNCNNGHLWSSHPNMNTSRLNSTHHVSCLDQQLNQTRDMCLWQQPLLCKFTACGCECPVLF